jgi:hypothetical protein
MIRKKLHKKTAIRIIESSNETQQLISKREKRPEGEADHLITSRTEVKNAWIYAVTPPILFHDVVLN